MNILILGSGGREHSIAWAVKQNPKCDRLIVAPGNAGIADVAECADINILDGDAIAAFASENTIPSQAAAALEASKSFTKEICDASGAPTAAYGHFTDADSARAYIREQGAPIVVKADGLAAGKGVIVAMTLDEALAAIDDMFDGSFGDAGAEVVIEEFMDGEEASFFVLCDGDTILPVGTAQDHKRAFDGDTGPNTGGMGAYSPAPVMTDAIIQKTLDDIVKPTVAEMNKRGTPFQGVLFVGLMIQNDQPRLVEYNVRFGDPECQCLMMRLGGQILDLLLACAEGRLADVQANWADDHAITIVLAANGYPGSYKKGTVIKGLDTLPEDSFNMTFHAGTTAKDGAITAIGGRVLAVTARGDTLQDAHTRAYAMANQIDWPEGFYRSDIGWRAL